jgi:hypothetical protein
MCSRSISGSDIFELLAGSETSKRYGWPSEVNAATRRCFRGSSAIEVSIRPSAVNEAKRKRPGTLWSIACQTL